MNAIVCTLVCVILTVSATLANQKGRPEFARIGTLDETRFNLYASAKGVPVAKAVSEAERLYKAEDYAKAQEAFKAIQAMGNADAIRMWAACMEAMCLANQEKYDTARTILKEIVSADPKSADAHLADYIIGATHKLAYEDDKAVAHFDAYLDNPDRKADTNYYDRALEWQLEQYRARSTSKPDDANLKSRFYQLLELWVKTHPERVSDYSLLYKYYRNQDKWSDCLRVAGYRMPSPQASIHVLNDRLTKTQDLCDATKLGAAEAAKAANPRIDEFKAESAKLGDLSIDARRALTFQLVQTFLACGSPEEGDKTALEWMASNPADRTAMYMYLGYLRSIKSARPEALDRIVSDFLKQKPSDDIRMDMLELYSAVATPIYNDKSRIEQFLKQYDAPPATMATLYTGWKEDEALECWKKVLADTNLNAELRFRAMSTLGDSNYKIGAIAIATNLYRTALAFTSGNTKYPQDLERFRDRVAQEYFKSGMTNEARELYRLNQNSRTPEYRMRANLYNAREHMNTGRIRNFCMGEQILRNILGQVQKADVWTTDIKYSEDPAVRRIQDEAKALCDKYELDLARQPMREEDWRARATAKTKAEYERKMKAH